MTTIDERLAQSPFKTYGLDATYLAQIEHRIGYMRRTPNYWPDRDTLDHSFVWTAMIPRPTRESGFAPTELERRQKEWDDAADRFKERLADYAAGQQRRQAEAAELERRRQERNAEEEQQRVASLTERLRREYFTVAGATETDFQRDLPGLLSEERRQAALAGAKDVRSPISMDEMMNPGNLTDVA